LRLPETALIVEVPEAEPLIGELRMRYDESAWLGVPAHVTVLYPFMAPELVSASVLAQLERLFSARQSFRFRLASIGRFVSTCYLEPSPAEPFVRLTEAVADAYPAFPPFGGEFPSTVPHLTVAHGSASQAEAASEAVTVALASNGPIEGVCRSVVLMENSSGRWRRKHEFSFAPEPGT
jgi:2'-5' RNA ligase